MHLLETPAAERKMEQTTHEQHVIKVHPQEVAEVDAPILQSTIESGVSEARREYQRLWAAKNREHKRQVNLRKDNFCRWIESLFHSRDEFPYDIALEKAEAFFSDIIPPIARKVIRTEQSVATQLKMHESASTGPQERQHALCSLLCLTGTAHLQEILDHYDPDSFGSFILTVAIPEIEEVMRNTLKDMAQEEAQKTYARLQ